MPTASPTPSTISREELETVTVIQADRDAAADMTRAEQPWIDEMWVAHIRTGGADASPRVQLLAHHRIVHASTLSDLSAARAEGEVDVTFEVWEDDMMIASSTDEADARHYLAVYSQDAPNRLVRAETRRTTIVPALSSPTGDAHEGSPA
jgi:hypothetical protein